jgi:hypothetical protein
MDAYRVNLFALKNEGGSASATVDLGSTKRFLAFGSVTMIDPLTDFDRDNAVAFDIYKIDGVRTNYRIYGGDHFGDEGANKNVYEGAYVGYGRRIEFWLRSIHHQDLDTFGVGIVITLE